MEGPRPGGTTLLIMVTPTPGKYDLVLSAQQVKGRPAVLGLEKNTSPAIWWFILFTP
jgi:hypothetical protein